MSGIRKAIVGILIAIAIILVGTIGYMLLEGWDCFDALYMTVITLTTVGYGETHKLGHTGKAFTLILIVVGAGVIFYIISMITEFVVEGQIREVLGRHKLEKQIKKLKDHSIICGYGRVGQTVCDIFSSKFNPSSTDVIEAGDTLIAIGADNDLAKLEKLSNP